MGKKRPEREIVEKLLQENRRRKAHDIAEETGLIAAMGYEKAVEYVKQVRKAMKRAGELPPDTAKYAPDVDRLEDITRLFELRQGTMSKKAAKAMLLLNCYYRLRSEDDTIHMGAIDDTYAKNADLKDPLDMRKAIGICELALEKYMDSIDEEKNEAAIKHGFIGAGLNYTSESLIEKLEITEEELQHMKSIRR